MTVPTIEYGNALKYLIVAFPMQVRVAICSKKMPGISSRGFDACPHNRDLNVIYKGSPGSIERAKLSAIVAATSSENATSRLASFSKALAALGLTIVDATPAATRAINCLLDIHCIFTSKFEAIT